MVVLGEEGRSYTEKREKESRYGKAFYTSRSGKQIHFGVQGRASRLCAKDAQTWGTR